MTTTQLEVAGPRAIDGTGVTVWSDDPVLIAAVRQAVSELGLTGSGDGREDRPAARTSSPPSRVALRIRIEIVDLRATDFTDSTHSTDPTALVPFAGRVVIAVGDDPAGAHPALEAGACDYLVVPVVAGRLHRALERAFRIAAPPPLPGDPAAGHRRFRSHLFLRIDDRVVPVSVDDLIWLEASRPHVIVHARSGRHRVRSTIARIEPFLDPALFIRVHRSALVRLDRIAEMVRRERGDFDLHLVDGTTTRLARRRATSLIRLIG